MMWGWHAHNGVSLGNPRLGFVCTMMTTDAQPGLEGYYVEADQPLAAEDRLRFRPGERPPGLPEPLPLPDWGADRLAKVERSYAMEYVRSIIPSMCEVLGPADAGAIGRTAGRQIGMQYADAVTARLELGPAPAFAEVLGELLRAGGDPVEVSSAAGGSTLVQMSSWRVLGGLALPPEAFEAWNGLWEGLAAVAGMRLDAVERLDLGDDAFTWRVRSAR
jgi:hypothetical protein